jgi:two-component system CheB/CheR fusion protein
MTADASEQPDRAPESAPDFVVGIGASAGGVEALRAFFSAVPSNSGIAYIVILHLSPEHDSRLAEVLQSTARIPVMQVRDPVRLERNRVCVVPPNAALVVADGVVKAAPVTRLQGRRAPVDMFFRALAEAYGTRAGAVVLSGTGPNGSSGLKRIKEFGGLAIAQDPAEAEYADMPKNAIATGLVDAILPVRQIPERLIAYKQRLVNPTVRLPVNAMADALEGGVDVGSPALTRTPREWLDILSLLKMRTGQDFSNYKPATIRRRIERRLNVRGLTSLAEYADLLRADAIEPLLLMKELLISVTNFFRDGPAFDTLDRDVVPRLFQGKTVHDQVRVWSAGCATGEEAYSLAMLLAEHVSALVDPPSIQIFATDLDEGAITVAREGLYGDADVVDVTPMRLQRFFQREADGFRVRRELRELVLFARHNVIKDPPFSHLDLVSCRNLLIYLNRPVQERLIETFHFALRPGGFLFLGTSESADTPADLFAVFDKEAHIFESRSISSRPTLPLVTERHMPALAFPSSPEPRQQADRISPGELHLRLLEQFAAPSLVVNEEYTLLHASEHAAALLQLGGGEPTRDVLKLAHTDLRADLRTALHLASRERSPIQVGGVRVQTDAGARVLRITVKPVLRHDAPPRGYFLVLFEDDQGVKDTGALEARPLSGPAEPESVQLAEELAHVKGQLRATIEQYESHAEEARAANEELQAMNEELRTAAEELETSKEELQSVNEELTTVNQELKIKIEELALTNNDFQNLINSTDIGTIFLDRSLNVKLSTPRAQDVFNLLPTDVGRRLSDITSRILYEPLHDDILQVLQRLQTIEREVQTREGRWYLMRILPYRTTDDRIDGVALTFHDITARRAAEMQVRASEERLRLLIDSVVDYAIFTVTEDGRIDSWNAGAQRMYGYAAEEIVGRDVSLLFTPEDRAAGLPAQDLGTVRENGRSTDERWHLRKDGSRFFCTGATARLAGGTGFAKIARDLTERRHSELALEQARDTLENRVEQRTTELQAEVARGLAASAQVSSLLRRVVTAQEDERARIARDLHDQLGQQLTALRMALERCRTNNTAVEPDDLDRALQLIHSIDREVDFLAWELRPAMLDDLGLAVALPRYVEEWSEHYKVNAEFHATSSIAGRLSPTAEITFYRVAQEALNNVAKHAHATRVDVMLETRGDAVVLVVEDDGVGFDTENRELAEHGIGLAGMNERAALIGATLQVESTPGQGTSVYLRHSPPHPQEVSP